MGMLALTSLLDPTRLLVLVVALAVIGWVFGFGAALLWRSVLGQAVGVAPRARMVGVVLAMVLGMTCLYGYGLVLAEVGVIAPQCGAAPIWNAPGFC